MAMRTGTHGANVAKIEWLHWLFVQGDRAISCSLEVRGDGNCVATLIPLWAPTEQIAEAFRMPAEAVRWQEVMTQRLHAAGWLLVEGGLVRNAA